MRCARVSTTLGEYTREKSSAVSVCTIAGTLLRSKPMPVTGVVAITCRAGSALGTGSGAGARPRYRRSAGRRRWSPRRRGCRPRRDDGDLGQRRRGLAPRNFRKHWRAWQYQRAQCSGLPQPPFAGRKSRPIPITPTRPTHHNAPEFPRSTLGHSGSSVLLRFANRGWNIWQCGRGDTPGRPLACTAHLFAAAHHASMELWGIRIRPRQAARRHGSAPAGSWRSASA